MAQINKISRKEGTGIFRAHGEDGTIIALSGEVGEFIRHGLITDSGKPEDKWLLITVHQRSKGVYFDRASEALLALEMYGVNVENMG